MKSILFALILFFSSTLSGAQSIPEESARIATFCKVWGFLKYHHPRVAKGNIDWDKEFMTRINEVTLLKSKEEISNYYLQWIKGLGTVKKCTSCDEEIPGSFKLNLDLAWLSDANLFSPALIDQLQFIYLNRNHGKNHYVRLKGVTTDYSNEKAYEGALLPHKEMRLLGLARYWNIINYFYPYKYKIGRDWNEVLVEMIPKFRDAGDTRAYHLAMLELVAKVNDSHAWVYSKRMDSYFGTRWIPAAIRFIDNKAIVTRLYNEELCRKNDLRVGDVFLKWNDRTIGDLIHEQSIYRSGSNEASKLRLISGTLFSGLSDSAKATIDRNGVVTEKTIYRYPESLLNLNGIGKQDTCRIFDGNIGYLNMGLVQFNQVNKLFTKLKDTRAIILDIRNYPRVPIYIFSNFFNTERKPFAKSVHAEVSNPGIFRYQPARYTYKKGGSSYAGRVVLLFNETTMSYAEWMVMALQTAPRVISVGSHTAGTDGNVTFFTFPGNYTTSMTGLGVYYPDGRETQRIGIVPDVEVRPTIEGIRQGRDEVLEKAIEVARQEGN